MASEGRSSVSYFLIGLGIGAVLALLFAPRSGRETRDRIRTKAEEGKEFLSEKVQELRSRAEEYAEKGKESLRHQRDSLAAAVEAGKQAYREEKHRV